MFNQLTAFRGKSWQLLTVLILLALSSKAQTLDTSRVRQGVYANPGYDYIGLGASRTLRLPQDTFPQASRDSGAISVKNGVIYLWRNGHHAAYSSGADNSIATGSRTAIGDYTQNWANHWFFLNNLKALNINSSRIDPVYPGNIKTFSFYSDSTADTYPLWLKWSLRDVSNTTDSLGGGLTFNKNSSQLEVFDGSKQSVLTVADILKLDPADSVRVKLVPAAAADSVVGVRSLGSGLNTLVKIPTPAGGSITQPNQQVVFGTGSGVTSQNAFIYNSSTHKLSADSAHMKLLKTDSAARLGARTTIGQDAPIYSWQTGDQFYSDGGMPGLLNVVGTDSVNCIACVPNQMDSTKGRGIWLMQFGGTTGGNFIRTIKSRGNWLHPSALLNQDILSGWGLWGWGTTKATGSTCGFHGVASENFTDTHWGSELWFFTTPNGTAGRTWNLKLLNDGSSLFAGQVNTTDLLVQGPGSRIATVNSTDGGAAFARFQRSGVTTAVFGTASTTDQYFTGTVANDLAIRSGASGGSPANILWSTDAATTAMKLTTSNDLYIGGTDGTAKVGLIGSSGALRLNGGATDNNVSLYNASTNNNLAIPILYPSSTGNDGVILRLIPKGTGFNSSLKTRFDLWNTDLISDGTNYEGMYIAAAGTSYNFNSFSGGTGTARPFAFQVNGTDVFNISTAGVVKINNAYTLPTTTATDGYVMTYHTGGSATWDAPAGGITTINSQTGSSQTLAGGAGLIVNSSSNTHTINFTTDLDAQVTDANNTGTSATDLYSKTIAANQCTLNGQSIHFEAAGINNDATATVNLEALFAGNGIAGTGAVTISATGVWSMQGTIIRASSTTARVYTVVTIDNCTQKVFSTTANLTGIDWTATNILKIRATAGGAGGGSNDITAQMWKVVFQP